MSAYIKYRPALPIYVYVIIVAVIVALIITLLSFAGYIDLTVVVNTLIGWTMAPIFWATTGIAQTLILYVGGALIVFFIAFLIVKRKYVTGQKIQTPVAPTYQPQVSLSTPSIYPQQPTQPAQPQPEEQKKEETST